ncbi:unnamed protein product [Heligmosomoides polygyrus]|uniref:Methyltransf_21 domain-containing protein n=1 Tax=Heligmosomoides polygyrus TaxID=6339 RepID=A0A183GK37_HELPZ|nr:unnamed protein product [Heligmosomoides polygyrus]
MGFVYSLFFQKNISVIVTLGIGLDTKAEESLLKELPVGSLFYGADPIIGGNEQLYSKFGTYFPFAVGGKSGIYKTFVLDGGSYKERSVVHIDLTYFLSKILSHKVYDNLWIDAEGGEYEMFPAFYRDDQLDQSGITVCQFNMEVHSPNRAQKEMFRKFVFQIIRDSRYAFFRAVAIAGHIRLFAVNFDDAQCVAEYVAPPDT